MENFRIATDSDRIATVWFDTPGKSVNTIGPATLAELDEIITKIEQENPAGVIFASAKHGNFIAGADLFEIRKMDEDQIEQFLGNGQRIFSRIEHLSMPTVAAINGDCLGGGLELALACRYRVAAQDNSVKIGLPEVKLGILPGFGGTVRMTRTIGMPAALPLLLAGKILPPRKALGAGLIDETVRPEALLEAAKRWAKSGALSHRPGFWSRTAAGIPLVRRKILAAARKQTHHRTLDHYPAPLKIIEVVGEGVADGPAAGFDAERRGLLELIPTAACRNLLRMFFLRQGSRRAALADIHAQPHDVAYAAVVGGGTMGSGIVHALISAGVQVRLIEMNDGALSAALVRIRAMLDQDVRDGRIDALGARHTFNRVAPTTQWDGLKLCDLAIEAVVEKIEAKREVFSKLDQLLPPHAIIASNTSSLRIADMAAATSHPNRVIGMHFFNPVPKMPLVEIVRAERSDDASLATAVALAGRLGKTPVVVKDAPGFLVNRVLIPYLAEAALLATEGVSIVQIDTAMKYFGWPMGPFELLDEVGLDIGAEVLKSLATTVPAYAKLPQSMSSLLQRGWLGKKSGMGFYVHNSKAKSRSSDELTVNPQLSQVWPTGSESKLTEDEIQWRLMLPMVNEAARVLEEGIAHNADAIDLATVMGLGFPPFRGGLAQFADHVGVAELLDRFHKATTQHGPRFEPSPLWGKLESQKLQLSQFVPASRPEPPAFSREPRQELQSSHA